MKLSLVVLLVFVLLLVCGWRLPSTQKQARKKKWGAFLQSNLMKHPAILKGAVLGRGGRVWGKDGFRFRRPETRKLFRFCVKPLAAVGKHFTLENKSYRVVSAWAGVLHARGQNAFIACGNARTVALVAMYKNPKAKEAVDHHLRQACTIAQKRRS